MWIESIHSPIEIDGYTIKVERMLFGAYDNEQLYKATTYTNFKYGPNPEPVKTVKYGSTLPNAVAELLNNLEPLKFAVVPVKLSEAL